MDLDPERIAGILQRDHSYYGSFEPPWRSDGWVSPSAVELLARQVTPEARVLDIGCGNGLTLLALSDRFAQGVGIDNDPAHLELARSRQQELGITNVEFQLAGLQDLVSRTDRFDVVYCERGPVGFDGSAVQAALRVLRVEGILFCEAIGDLHHQEVREVFGVGRRSASPLAGLYRVPARAQ